MPISYQLLGIAPPYSKVAQSHFFHRSHHVNQLVIHGFPDLKYHTRQIHTQSGFYSLQNMGFRSATKYMRE